MRDFIEANTGSSRYPQLGHQAKQHLRFGLGVGLGDGLGRQLLVEPADVPQQQATAEQREGGLVAAQGLRDPMDHRVPLDQAFPVGGLSALVVGRSHPTPARERGGGFAGRDLGQAGVHHGLALRMQGLDLRQVSIQSARDVDVPHQGNQGVDPRFGFHGSDHRRRAPVYPQPLSVSTKLQARSGGHPPGGFTSGNRWEMVKA